MMHPGLKVHRARHGRYRVEYVEGVVIEDVVRALNVPGECLKTSPKSETRRVGDWVVKRSTLAGGAGIVKHTLHRRRYRRAWVASIHLARHGVSVPTPYAYVEEGGCGIILRNALITGYLHGAVTVEEYARRMVAADAPPRAVAAFLDNLARAILGLTDAQAYHADLSGKNIFTADGDGFTFIDLDDVTLGRRCTPAQLLVNHVQLYDSFCDLWGPETLDPFIEKMIPVDTPHEAWVASVHRGQEARRARIEAIWRRQGQRPGA